MSMRGLRRQIQRAGLVRVLRATESMLVQAYLTLESMGASTELRRVVDTVYGEINSARHLLESLGQMRAA